MTPQPTPQQQMEAELNKRLLQFKRETNFPSAYLPKDFQDLALKCMRFVTPFAMRMTLEDYAAIGEKRAGYTLADMDILYLIIKMCTAHQLGLTLSKYLSLQKEVEYSARHFRKMMGEKQMVIMGELQKEMVEVSEPTNNIVLAPTAQA